MDNPKYYDCVFNFWWSDKHCSFPGERRFTVHSLEEIPDAMKNIILNITRQLAGEKYEGKIERYPMWIGPIDVTPVYEKFTLCPDESAEIFFRNEFDNVGIMMETNTLFVNSNYNMQLAKDNEGLEISFHRSNC